MKQKIILSHIFFLLAMIGSVSSVLLGGSYWMTIGLILIGMILVVVIFRIWMVYLTGVVNQSSQALNSKHVISSKWSLDYLDDIEENQELIKRKFKISAELIGNLAKNEVAATSNDLLVNDPIGEALEKIRNEMQKLKGEEEKRTWINVGLARFGEILRNKAEVNEYSHQIISNLVKYVQANQGALFIEYKDETNERYLELKACYAYDKRKYLENKIYEGQGLLGQCMLERDIIFITDIPKDYVKITSGLGQATPRNVIVAPLIFNNTFYGAIELALFEVMAPYRIEFLREVCDNIASEIATLKNTQHTEALLSESTVLTQELQTREEEMKQNLEELAATQEEMARKQAELSGVLSAIDSTLATAEFETDGTLIKCNTILEQFFESQPDQLKGSPYTRLIGSENQISWSDILSSKVKAGDFQTKTIEGKDLWLSVTFTAIINSAGITTRILCLIQDITQRKIKEGEFERLSLVANNTDNSVIITDKNGITEYVNAGFTKMSGYEPSQIIGLKPGRLLQGSLTDKNTILKLRKGIKEGIPIYEEILNYNSKGESYWVSLAINPVK
ncbi:MAG: PAS domain-containing protein, partial [Cyclobacteriaceae bacterium]|nr:PAS domain-containing protein [Cyclobacteriaceae bacterium]